MPCCFSIKARDSGRDRPEGGLPAVVLASDTMPGVVQRDSPRETAEASVPVAIIMTRQINQDLLAQRRSGAVRCGNSKDVPAGSAPLSLPSSPPRASSPEAIGTRVFSPRIGCGQASASRLLPGYSSNPPTCPTRRFIRACLAQRRRRRGRVTILRRPWGKARASHSKRR